MSAVAEHAIKTDHNIGWEDFEILDSQQKLYKRCYLESWHIKKEKETMNRDNGVLSQVYNYLGKTSPKLQIIMVMSNIQYSCYITASMFVGHQHFLLSPL